MASLPEKIFKYYSSLDQQEILVLSLPSYGCMGCVRVSRERQREKKEDDEHLRALIDRDQD
jgi:hypothetical protein